MVVRTLRFEDPVFGDRIEEHLLCDRCGADLEETGLGEAVASLPYQYFCPKCRHTVLSVKQYDNKVVKRVGQWPTKAWEELGEC